MTRRKFLSLLLAVFMMMTAIPCALAETQEDIVLSFYVPMNECTDHDMVWDAVNDYLSEKIGVRLDVHFLASADFKAKVPTMLSSGQEMDIVFTNSSYDVDLAAYAKMGALMPLDDLIDENMPLCKASLPEILWNGPTYNGQTYGVPIYKDMASNADVFWNQTLLDEIGFEQDLTEFEWSSQSQWKDIFYEIRAKLDEAGSECPIVVRNPNMNVKYYGAIDSLIGHNFAITNIPEYESYAGYEVGEVFNLYATEEYKEWCLMHYNYVQDGIWPMESWLTIDPDDAYWYDGELPFNTAGGHVYMAEDQYSTEWTTKISFSEMAFCDATTVGKYAYGISSTCKYPEKALQVLDLFNGDPYLATMIRFGIENVHWIFNEDGETITFQFEGSRNADSENRGYYYWYGWQLGSIFAFYTPTDITTPEFIPLLKALNERAVPSKYVGFKFVKDNVVDEIAACANVVSQYNTPLWNGTLSSEEEVLSAIDALNAGLEANGLQKIIDEVEAQLRQYEQDMGI